MSYLISVLFIIAGLINFAPLIGARSNEQLTKLYQIDILDQNVGVLLRHRAFLFGIVGAIIILAAFLPALRLTATIAGLISMVSYIVLVFAMRTSNPNLVRVAWIDVFATFALLLGFALHLWCDQITLN
ncbi:MAG: phosphopantetheine adenylyltransferase [Proteobacteria bacterium]|nr:phosphopantetheine adenylyltransferase [Pseudomonadota bacterium]